jgi:hypothetical protein
MSVRHSIALPVVVSLTLALTGCDRITSGLEKARYDSKASKSVRKERSEPKAGPSARNVSLTTPIRRALPTNQNAMNWHVPPAPPSTASRAVDLGPAINDGWRPLGAAVSQSGRAVMTYTNSDDASDGDATRMAVIDVTQGRIDAAWEVPDLCIPLDIHPDGLTTILCRQDEALSERETLYVYRIPYDGSPVADAWKPLIGLADATAQPSERQTKIRWLQFAGPERLVTLNDDRTIHVWEFPSKLNLGSIPNVVGTPAVSPDGTRVAFLADDMLALLDPSAAQVVAAGRVGPLPSDPLIAFRSNGLQLAITGIGKTMIVDLATGQLTHSETSRTHTSKAVKLMPDLAWIGRFLYRDQRIYDFESAIPLWRYSGIEWAMPMDDRLWVVVRSNSSKQFVLQPIRLPVDKVETQVTRTYSPELIALRTGDKVRIDVSAIPADRQAEIGDLLSKHLTENGFHPFDRAAIVLRASIDQPMQAAVTYVNFRGAFAPPLVDPAAEESRTCYFNRQPARLQIIVRNRILWSTSQYILPPVFLQRWPEDSILTECGGPDYSLFENRQLPNYVRGTRNAVLGRTQLLAE